VLDKDRRKARHPSALRRPDFYNALGVVDQIAPSLAAFEQRERERECEY